jgi:hypothetical protein
MAAVTPVVGPQVLQAAAVANGNGTQLDCGGLSNIGVQVTGITTATVNFEATIDGSTWYPVSALAHASATQVTSTAADGLFRADVRGFLSFRARISGWSVGAITVTAVGVYE